MDNDEDSVADGVAWDANRDGSPDTFVFDVNENGIPDEQEMRPWTPEPATPVDPLTAETERQVTESINTLPMIAGNDVIPGVWHAPPAMI